MAADPKVIEVLKVLGETYPGRAVFISVGPSPAEGPCLYKNFVLCREQAGSDGEFVAMLLSLWDDMTFIVSEDKGTLN